MMRSCFGFAMFLTLLAGSASAQVQCSAPFMPIVPDGATATEEEMVMSQEEVIAFMRDSDGYQQCMVSSLRQLEVEASGDADEQVSPQVRRTMVSRVEANQNLKIRISEEFNAALTVYTAALPPEEEQDNSVPDAPPES